MMNKHWLRGISLVAVGALFLGLVPSFTRQANAGTILIMRDYLNRQQADVASGIQHEIFFTEISGKTSTDNEVRMIFPDGDDTKWCRTVGSLTVTGITEPTGTFVTGESATGLLGSLSATCAQGSGAGAAESNRDRLLITGVGALVASTRYGVRLSSSTGVLGTAAAAGNSIQVETRTYEDSGTLEDSGTFATALVADDQIGVSASVDPTLTVSLSGDPVALGTLTTAAVSYDGITSAITTNAATGYVSMVKYDNTLTSGANTIDDTAGGTIAIGSEEYGVSSSDTDVSSIIGTSDASPSCSTSTQTTVSTVTATALTTTFKQFAGATAAGSETTTLCFLAGVSATTAAGSYTSTATVVTTARF